VVRNESRSQDLAVIDAAGIARAQVDGVDHRLQVELEVRIRFSEWYGNDRQRPSEMSAPNEAALNPMGLRHQQCVEVVRPGVVHGHAFAATQQVDLDQVDVLQQQGLALAQIVVPSGCI